VSAETARGETLPDPVNSSALNRQPSWNHARANSGSDLLVRRETPPRRDASVIADLVSYRARKGEQQAWDALVARYAPLIWSICRKYRLHDSDAEDASQGVWLHLVDHLDSVRDPAALPGWLTTTTQRECSRVLRVAQRSQAVEDVPDIENIPGEQVRTVEQELLVLSAMRHFARRSWTCPQPHQRLIALLAVDPPLSYAEIAARLGIPIGSVGPTRARCLDRLRRHPAIIALISVDSSAADNNPQLSNDLEIGRCCVLTGAGGKRHVGMCHRQTLGCGSPGT